MLERHRGGGSVDILLRLLLRRASLTSPVQTDAAFLIPPTRGVCRPFGLSCLELTEMSHPLGYKRFIATIYYNWFMGEKPDQKYTRWTVYFALLYYLGSRLG